MALERDIVLIPDDVWKQGPAVVNARIAELINQHVPKRDSDAELDAILDRPTRFLALADWALIQHLMRLQPFADDYRDVIDLPTKQARADLLSSLAELGAFLIEDVEDERLQFEWVGQFLRDLGRYTNEAARGIHGLRPRLLMTLGSRLRDAWMDEEIASGLPDRPRGDLENLLDQHSELVQSYFSGALARLQELSGFELPGTATPEMIVALVQCAAEAVNTNALQSLKQAHPEDQAVLSDMALHLKELNAERDRSVDPEHRARLERKIREQGTTTTQTLFGLVLNGGKIVLGGGAVLADLKTLFPEDFKEIWDALWDWFGDKP